MNHQPPQWARINETTISMACVHYNKQRDGPRAKYRNTKPVAEAIPTLQHNAPAHIESRWKQWTRERNIYVLFGRTYIRNEPRTHTAKQSSILIADVFLFKLHISNDISHIIPFFQFLSFCHSQRQIVAVSISHSFLSSSAKK